VWDKNGATAGRKHYDAEGRGSRFGQNQTLSSRTAHLSCEEQRTRKMKVI
jgi:hypothetical protein